MKKIFTLIAACILSVMGAWAEDGLIFTEDFSGETYKVSWGGTSAGGISPEVKDGVLTVANGSQSGDRGAYVSFGTNAYEGSAHLTFDMKVWKSGWSGKNNTFYIYPTEEKNRYPSRTDAVLTISQDASGAISINGNALGTYDGTNLTYDVYLDAENGTVSVTVLNGTTEINTFNLATTATGIGAFHLTFNKNYGSYAIDNISLSSWTPEAPSHNYTINAVVGTTVLKKLATGVASENGAYEINGLPYSIIIDGVCYKLNDSDVTGYKKSFTMGKADETKTVSYSKTNDFNYFFEAESILSRSYGNNNGTYSGGTTAAVYSGANLTMSNIAAGIYTITVNSSVRRANEDILNVQTSTNGTDWVDAGVISLTSNVGGNYSIDNVALNANGSIRLVEGKSQNMCHYVDYVTLKNSAEYVAVNENGTASYVTGSDLDFTGSTLKAYVATEVSETAITLKEVEKVAAGQAIVVKGESAMIPVTEEAVAPETNLFQSGAITVAEGQNVYALSKEDGQFHQVAEGVAIPEGKAYIVAGSTSAKTLALDFGGEATGVSNATVAKQNTAAFNLMGQKVNANAKGIVIINGKKFNNK